MTSERSIQEGHADGGPNTLRRVGMLLVGQGEAISGTVYGTIIVLATITAGAAAFRDDLWRLCVIIVATVLVVWIAHVYSHGLGQSLHMQRRLTWSELTSIARREYAIPLAAVLPLISLILGATGILAGSTAVWLAVGIGVATLTLEGWSYARLERLNLTATIATVAVNLALGMTIVLLKALVAH
jgi:hypothetical protein